VLQLLALLLQCGQLGFRLLDRFGRGLQSARRHGDGRRLRGSGLRDDRFPAGASAPGFRIQVFDVLVVGTDVAEGAGVPGGDAGLQLGGEA
jgi:hypothetical protein